MVIDPTWPLFLAILFHPTDEEPWGWASAKLALCVWYTFQQPAKKSDRLFRMRKNKKLQSLRNPRKSSVCKRLDLDLRSTARRDWCWTGSGPPMFGLRHQFGRDFYIAVRAFSAQRSFVRVLVLAARCSWLAMPSVFGSVNVTVWAMLFRSFMRCRRCTLEHANRLSIISAVMMS